MPDLTPPASAAGHPSPPSQIAVTSAHDSSFTALVAARRAWIEGTLRPWCRAAGRTELRLAEAAWADLAGDVSPRETLWAWAWERFPALCEPGLAPPSESRPVRVALTDGSAVVGTPDGRRSMRGELWLVTRGAEGWEDRGPFPLDEIASVTVAEPAPDRGADPGPRTVTMPH